MTKAINLANFANNVDATGNVDPNALAFAVPVAKGGTGSINATSARAALGVPATDGTGATGSLATAVSAFDANGALKEKKIAIASNNIDLSTGNFFSKTITSAITFTVSNTPATGIATSFILDLTNGGSFAITWWANVKWAGGLAPTLTSTGRDVLGFFTYDSGTTWTGLVLGKDIK
jgi:hypothetical protein